jgi:hypothetical protein
LKSGWDLAK